MVRYEVWGRKELGQGKRLRLAHGLTTERGARTAREGLKAEGFKDAVIVQRPAKYGRTIGVQRQGRE
jgi:hypothetical protein